MKILIINWRSIKDPAAGGAEQVTLEHAKRWVKDNGAEVYWLSPRYDQNIDSEEIEGVKFHYIGLPLGVTINKLIYTYPLFFIKVFSTYITTYRNKIDIVIECIHGIPLLTKFYSKQKVLIYLQEVAGNIWDKMFKFPVNFLGKNIERFFIRLYKGNTFVVGSASAKEDLINLGINEKNIKIINHGVQLPVFEGEAMKEKDLTLLFLNRMVKMKGVERALSVFSKLMKQYPDAKLWLVGKYNPGYKSYLEDMAEKLKIKNSIQFFGFVDDDKKTDLLRKAHILINPSYKEGWGLCNIEANRQGTPVVAYNVEGNCDSVENGVSGYLVEDGNEEDMLKAIIKAYNNKGLAKTAKGYSRQFNWDDKSQQFYDLLEQELKYGKY